MSTMPDHPHELPRRQEVRYWLGLLLLAAIVLLLFCLITGINLHLPAQFADMIEGDAHRPYVTRVLVPSGVRLLAATMPETAQQWLTARAASFGGAQFTRWMAAPPAYATELLYFLLLAYGCLVGFGIGLRKLAEVLHFPSARAISLLGLAGVSLFLRQGYLYDFSVLLTWTWLFVFAERRRWWGYLAVTALAALNKETALLAPLFWLVYGWSQRKELPFWRVLVAQSAIVGAIWLALRWTFQANPGDPVEIHWPMHAQSYLANPWAIVAIAGLTLATLVLAWPQAPRLLRSATVLLLPMVALYVVSGFPYEMRVFYELYPAGVLFLALALDALRRRLPPALSPRLSIGAEHAFLTITLLVAWTLRIVWLDILPAQLSLDETVNALIAGNLSWNSLALYLSGADGSDPLLPYLLSVVQDILAENVFALRIINAIAGVAAVALLYCLTRDLTSPRIAQQAQRPGAASLRSWQPLLAAMTLATALWPITAGRLVMRAGLTLPLFTLTLLLFWRAWSRRSLVYAILAGAALSLSFYTTALTVWLVVVLLAFAVSSWLVATPAQPGDSSGAGWRRGVIFVVTMVTAALCSLPQIVTYAQHAELATISYTSDTVFFTTELAVYKNAHDLIEENYLTIFEDLVYPIYTEDGRIQRQPLIGAPMHNPLSLVFFLIGVILALRRFANAGYRLAFIWFAVMLAPALLAGWIDHKILYLIGLAPPAALLGGIGGDALLRRIPSRLTRPGAAATLFVVILLANSFLVVWTYTTWASGAAAAIPAPQEQTDANAADIRYPLRARFENGVTLLGYSLTPDRVDCTESGRPTVRLTTYWQRSPSYGGPLYVPHMFTHFELPDRQIQDHRLLRETYPVTVWGTDEIVSDYRDFVVPAEAASGRAHFEIGLFRRNIVAEYERVSILDDAGNRTADQIVLGPILICEPAPKTSTDGLTVTDAVFDGRIRLLGQRQTLDTDGEPTLHVELDWQALERMPTDYSAFVHLIDETGAIVSQHDQQMQSQGVPTSLWVPSESARGHFVLPAPAEVDPTALRLRIGIYEPVSGRQLPVAAGGTPAGATFLVLPVAPE